MPCREVDLKYIKFFFKNYKDDLFEIKKDYSEHSWSIEGRKILPDFIGVSESTINRWFREECNISSANKIKIEKFVEEQLVREIYYGYIDINSHNKDFTEEWHKEVYYDGPTHPNTGKEHTIYKKGKEIIELIPGGRRYREGFFILYEGEYKNGVRHGQGTSFWLSGHKYEGEFKNGWRHGQGTYTWSDGTKYEGEFKKNLRHGLGKLISDQNIYKNEGFWKKDVQNKGTFSIYFPTGEKHVYKYKNGVCDNKLNTLYITDISDELQAYVGEIKFEKPEGLGYVRTEDAFFAGKWSKGKKHGPGILLLSNGNYIKGNWANDNVNGKCLEKRNNIIYEAEWLNGQRLKKIAIKKL